MGEGASFAISWPAFAAIAGFLAAVFFAWRWLGGFEEPFLAFSDMKSIIPSKASWRVSLANLPRNLMWAGLVCFAIAFVDPHLMIKRPPKPAGQNDNQNNPPVEGIAIYLLLDRSGSMGEEVPVYSPTGPRRKMTKIDLLKQVTKQFIEGDPALGLAGRPDDLIGLIYFARGASVQSPLTLDHEALLKQLAKFKVIGNRDQDGTAIGYAIFKAANLIAATKHYSQELISKGEPAYTIKNSIIILITDGLQDPNPLDYGKRLRMIDIPGAAEYAKEQGVRLYIINLEPDMILEKYAPNRHQMERSAELTGGKLFLMTNTTNLEQIYSEIDRLEKSRLPPEEQELINKEERPDLYRRLPFAPYFIAVGLICLFAAAVLESTVLRRVP